jgi:hypothetical protein
LAERDPPEGTLVAEPTDAAASPSVVRPTLIWITSRALKSYAWAPGILRPRTAAVGAPALWGKAACRLLDVSVVRKDPSPDDRTPVQRSLASRRQEAFPRIPGPHRGTDRMRRRIGTRRTNASDDYDRREQDEPSDDPRASLVTRHRLVRHASK